MPFALSRILTVASMAIATKIIESNSPVPNIIKPVGVASYNKIGSPAPTKNAKWITDVTKPTITVFRPAKDKNTGTAILVCPGGGYWNLAWDLEGEEVATWLNTVGVTGGCGKA